MKYIELTKGLRVKVDDEDYENLNQFKWYALQPTRNKNNYAARGIVLNGKRTIQYMHRVIMESKQYVDHINNDSLDNRRENLRIATPAQSNMNRTSREGSSCKYLGVSITKGKYCAYIGHRGKKYYLGSYNNPNDAAIAYNNKAIELFGQFANLNVIQ